MLRRTRLSMRKGSGGLAHLLSDSRPEAAPLLRLLQGWGSGRWRQGACWEVRDAGCFRLPKIKHAVMVAGPPPQVDCVKVHTGVKGTVRPERFELPTFWFVGDGSGESKCRIVRCLRGKPILKSVLSWAMSRAIQPYFALRVRLLLFLLVGSRPSSNPPRRRD